MFIRTITLDERECERKYKLEEGRFHTAASKIRYMYVWAQPRKGNSGAEKRSACEVDGQRTRLRASAIPVPPPLSCASCEAVYGARKCARARLSTRDNPISLPTTETQRLAFLRPPGFQFSRIGPTGVPRNRYLRALRFF